MNRRFQFTVGQLVQLIIVSAFVFWMMRAIGVTAALLAYQAVDSVVRARTTGVTGIGWSTLYRGLVLIAFGVTYCTYYYFYPTPGALRGAAFIFGACSLVIIYPVATRLLHAFINRGYQMPPKDEACGPIAWGGLGDWREPAAPVSQDAVEATGEASRSRSLRRY